MPDSEHHFLRKPTNWKALYFYQKAEALYQLTYAFKERFLKKNDRSIDQMVQAARSITQNIIEGSEDGITSTEIEVKLNGVSKGSLQELLHDYEQYLETRGLVQWEAGHPRYDGMVEYCRRHNGVEDYKPFFAVATDEELANIAISLCHFIDKMIAKHLANLEQDFVENGGIKERMTAARLGRRQTQNQEISALKARVAELEAEVTKWRTWYAEQQQAGKP